MSFSLQLFSYILVLLVFLELTVECVPALFVSSANQLYGTQALFVSLANQLYCASVCSAYHSYSGSVCFFS